MQSGSAARTMDIVADPSGMSLRRSCSTRTCPCESRDLVALGLDAQRFGFGRRTRDQRQAVEQVLHDVDADGFADRRVGTLSGGEQQRVLIAHALISRPKLLLLDEPLANLDPKSVQEIVALLHRVSKEHEVAILLSAHEMNALLPVMDRIVYLTDGRAASGTTDEVVRTDVLEQALWAPRRRPPTPWSSTGRRRAGTGRR